MKTLATRIKRLSLLLALLVAAIGASFIVEAGRRGASGERRQLLSVDPAGVERLEFFEAEASLVLQRSGAAWFVEDGARRLKARSERVEALLEALRQARSLRRVARNIGARESLGLGAASAGLRALDSEGKTLLELRVGDYDAAGRSIFVALAASPESWSTSPDFASYLGASRKAWLDLRLGGPVVEASEVSALSASGALTLDAANGERYEADLRLERDATGAWRLSGSPETPVDAAAADRAVRMLLGLEADDIADDAAAARVATASALNMSLELADGTRRTWSFSEAGEGRFEGTSTEAPYPFEASAYRLRSALPRLEDLKAEN